jgi:LysR family carnitine catabolism transcriptional activator
MMLADHKLSAAAQALRDVLIEYAQSQNPRLPSV